MSLDQIKVPGVVWVGLLMAVAIFLEANFANAEWYSLAIGFVLAVIKALQVDTSRSIDDSLPKQYNLEGNRTEGPSRLMTWLLG